MAYFRHNNRIALIVIFSMIILMLVCICFIMWFRTGEEASVGIFSLAVTLLGTIFIAVELKNGQNVTCSDMLIDLNNYFHDSDRLMTVYEALETKVDNPEDCALVWDGVRDVEIAQYATFFENLFLLYRNEVASIEDLDDLFGYRFFIFMNNPYIQENYILPTSSSYVQLFKLYEAWIKFRKRKDSDWHAHMPYARFAYTEQYLKGRLYLKDESFIQNNVCCDLSCRERTVKLRALGFRDVWNIIRLQEEIQKSTDPEIYCPLTREEILESLHLDTVLGALDKDGELLGVAVLVSNRKSPRNLAHDFQKSPESVLTFDAVFVSPRSRGLGLQRKFVDMAKDHAVKSGVRYILTTVSPSNRFSLDNFEAGGFETVSEYQKYGGKLRRLLCYVIPQNQS